MMRRRNLALLTAMVMVFTSIPASSLSLASDTDTTLVITAPPVATAEPTVAPTEAPTPTSAPTEAPTEAPAPTSEPTEVPTEAPTSAPTETPEFEIQGDVLVRYHGKDKKVVIPKTVREIGEEAFLENVTLEELILGENVEIIRERAFADCENLTTVIVNEKLAKIEKKAFENCVKLDVSFADQVEKVAGNAFKGIPEKTAAPTAAPTAEPATEPTAEPTAEPTVEPTVEPTAEPTAEPTPKPTEIPSPEKTDAATSTELERPGQDESEPEIIATESDLEEPDVATESDLPQPQATPDVTDPVVTTDTDLGPVYSCGMAEHIHSQSCCDADGALICSRMEHTHTAECMIVALSTDLTADVCFVYAGEEPASFQLNIAGGHAPYDVRITAEIPTPSMSVDLLATTTDMIASVEALGESSYEFAYAPTKEGMHHIVVKTTAADGESVSDVFALQVINRTYSMMLAEVEAWEAIDAERDLMDEETAAAEELYRRIIAVHEQDLLTNVEYEELIYRLGYVLYKAVAEYSDGVAWRALVASGYFNTRAEDYLEEDEEAEGGAQNPQLMRSSAFARDAAMTLAMEDINEPSDVQVIEEGGSKASTDGTVRISKTIDGTDLENVFDITLTVETEHEISEIYNEPNLAVVIVMDISNTMTYAFGGNSTAADETKSRYYAAMTAAETFIKKFYAAVTTDVSKIGFVAFNTDAYEIFAMQRCRNKDHGAALIDEMKADTKAIISASGYADSHSRFTNIEAGLAMAASMLEEVDNENKYIIFLSDGFPTTYMKSAAKFTGYDPYTPSGTIGTDGVFYDSVSKKYCMYGTSYSDTAAIRARKMATSIKNDGVKIFSIGVDIGGQTVQYYVNQTVGKAHSIVDRTSTTYEIGDASSASAYKTWLQSKIGSGSGYYFDSNDKAALEEAYKQIFEKIKSEIQESSQADWVAEDPLPLMGDGVTNVEFIGFYDQQSILRKNELEGGTGEGAENTAVYSTTASEISWDLKNSGYTISTVTQTDGTKIATYNYELVYRVRLQNEAKVFVEKQEYKTNDTTTLSYRYFTEINGQQTVSEVEYLNFPIPSVNGYLAEFSFTKIDQLGNPLPGTEFTLAHDDALCLICHGDKTITPGIGPYTAAADEIGTVSFNRIPSGHTYTLTETMFPAGVGVVKPQAYSVVVAYDGITITPNWNGEVTNNLTELSIIKIVEGPEEALDDSFNLKLMLAPPMGETLKDSYLAVYYTLDEKEEWVATGHTVQIKSGDTFTLTDSQKLTIYGLPIDTEWSVEELNDDGYKASSQVDGGLIRFGPVSDGSIPNNGSTTVTYTNTMMFELPHTGGAGTDLYTWAGLLLCGMSCLMYRYSKRRKGIKEPT